MEEGNCQQDMNRCLKRKRFDGIMDFHMNYVGGGGGGLGSGVIRVNVGGEKSGEGGDVRHKGQYRDTVHIPVTYLWVSLPLPPDYIGATKTKITKPDLSTYCNTRFFGFPFPLHPPTVFHTTYLHHSLWLLYPDLWKKWNNHNNSIHLFMVFNDISRT